jgi:hypothetical protein
MWTLLMLLLAANAVACPKGSSEYRGECVLDIEPEKPPTVKPDNVKRPERGTPTYMTGEVNLFNAPNLRDQDEKQDQEKAQAEQSGKRAAGLLSR